MLINLMNALRLRRMRQYQLADAVGVSEGYLSRVITGRRQANIILRKHIATALQADEEWLFQNAQQVPAAKRAAEVRAGAQREATA